MQQIDQLGTIYDSILILDFGSQYSHLIARRVRELGVYCELHPCNVALKSINFSPKGFFFHFCFCYFFEFLITIFFFFNLGIILSGGPYSVYDTDAPHVDKEVWNLNVPILGICYGLQVLFTFFLFNSKKYSILFISFFFKKKIRKLLGLLEEKSLLLINVNTEKHLFNYVMEVIHFLKDSPEILKSVFFFFFFFLKSIPFYNLIIFFLISTFLKVWMSHGDQLSKLPKDFKTSAITTTSPHTAISCTEKNIYG